MKKSELQKMIIALREKCEQEVKELKNLEELDTIESGVRALYCVYYAWNSKEYTELENYMKIIKGKN